MLGFLIRHLRPVLWILFVILAISVWSYVSDLRSRFPNADFKRSRIGVASWYSESDERINERTASNEPFDEKAMTCASWDYPFGERLLIINSFNGEWVVCRVNDRGPNKRLHRKVDLTKAAFRKISKLKRGLINVFIIPTEKKEDALH